MTDAQIARIAAPEKARGVRVARGLTLWAYPSGEKVWRFRCRAGGTSESVTLGRWPGMTADKARAEAVRLLHAADRGQSPRGEYRRRRYRGGADEENPTVRQFGERWMGEVVEKVRKDPAAVRRYLARDVYPALGARRVAQVQGREVQRMIFARRDAGKPQAAAALRHLLKRLFDYAKACGVRPDNPVDLTPRKFIAPRRARVRSLSESELRAFLRVVRSPAAGRMGAALELMLLTLCRKSELRLARWEHVDLAREVWEVPPELSKTGQAHIVYLSRQAKALFARLKAFAGKAEAVLPALNGVFTPVGPATLNKWVSRQKWGIPAFTPHDLRRTASTLLNEQGYDPDWIEKCLNHNMRGVRGVYNRAQYAEQRKQMLQAWADWLEGLGQADA